MNPTLEVTVQIPCNNNCSFCPQKKLIDSYTGGEKKITNNRFADIISTVPKNVRIDFSGFCEPFLHEDVPLMMSHAYHKGFKIVLYTTLCGFTQSDSKAISHLKFDLVMIHVPDLEYYTNGGSFKWKLEEFLKTGIEPQYMAMGPVSEEITDATGGLIQIPPMLSRGSNNDNMPKVPLKRGKIKCTIAGKDFDHNVILPNGDVHLCCMDYGLGYKIGNLLTQTYDQIMHGDKLKAIKAAAETEDDHVLCRRCEWGQLC